MSRRRVGGVLVIIGPLLAIAATLAFPMAWVVSNWLWIVSGIVMAAGLLVVSLSDRSLLSIAGAGVLAVGVGFWVAYAYQRSLDPGFSAEGLWMEGVFAWLSAVGLALMGVGFLRSGFAKWVAYVNVGYALLFVVAFILVGSALYDSFPPQIVYVVSLATGIVALKGAGQRRDVA